MSIAEYRETLVVPPGRSEVDVAIVGAGMAGTTMATVLGKAGRKVALIDPHRVHHDEFRAEKIGADQMQLFGRLDFEETVMRLV
ncbi:FAD-binding protein, partial [bacterium M00.F.Ca.ET.179.01.1.1]